MNPHYRVKSLVTQGGDSPDPLRVSVFGLGYVGCVSAACFAARGHTVLGVDANPEKTRFLRDGRSPIVEERIGDLVADGVRSGALQTRDDPAEAVRDSDVTIVCVGTPSTASGALSTAYLERVSEEIGRALADKDGRHVVVFRSTMLPGTCEQLLIPILERESGRTLGDDLGVCVNPEYLREGTSVRDFLSPPKTVLGESDTASGDLVLRLYAGLPGPRFRVPIAIAEMSKYVDNGFHALKVAFANEIGAVCAANELDSHAVMELFFADDKLNISSAYLRPGFAFGGSCLPKDLRALTYTARRSDLDVPVLSNILHSNEMQVRRAIEMVVATGRRKVGILGLSFKSGTDDLRESPLVELAERLSGKGCDIRIFDRNVALSRLVGANRSYLDEKLPHINGMLVDDPQQVIDHAEVCVVGTREPEVLSAVDAFVAGGPDRIVIDLVRVPDAAERRGDASYHGIAW